MTTLVEGVNLFGFEKLITILIYLIKRIARTSGISSPQVIFPGSAVDRFPASRIRGAYFWLAVNSEDTSE